MASDDSDRDASNDGADPPKKRHCRFVDLLTEVPNGDIASAKELKLIDRELTSLDTLEPLKSLVKLELRGNHLVSLNFIEMNHALCWLGIAKNSIRRLSSLDNLSSLAVLDISDNRITRLDGLGGLSSLKTLIAARNRISSLDGLSSKKHRCLETLVLSHNRISECTLVNYPSLFKLSLGHNKLHAFPKVSRLPSLSELRLNGNQIPSVSAVVSELPKLTILDVGSNLIVNRQGFESITGLLWLKSLSLRGNTVSEDTATVEAVLGTLPRLEIYNDRRREGVAKGKKRGLGATQRVVDKPKPPAPISIGGRSFEGKRAVFRDDDSADELMDRRQPEARPSESKRIRRDVEDPAMVKPASSSDRVASKRPVKKAKLKKKGVVAELATPSNEGLIKKRKKKAKIRNKVTTAPLIDRAESDIKQKVRTKRKLKKTQ